MVDVVAHQLPHARAALKDCAVFRGYHGVSTAWRSGELPDEIGSLLISGCLWSWEYEITWPTEGMVEKLQGLQI